MACYVVQPRVVTSVSYAKLGDNAKSPGHSSQLFLCRLVTLAVQNSLLTIIMHYSRVSTPPSRSYSAATAVLLNELLKGSISLAIAFSRIDRNVSLTETSYVTRTPSTVSPRMIFSRIRTLGKEVFSPDCWKLSIPAILYGKRGHVRLFSE